ncbi:hypothetical protein FKB34_11340 [Glycocaulis profundi]|nr:hypothetical protein FKB34_11340 [Glycocaulis profundi]
MSNVETIRPAAEKPATPNPLKEMRRKLSLAAEVLVEDLHSTEVEVPEERGRLSKLAFAQATDLAMAASYFRPQDQDDAAFLTAIANFFTEERDAHDLPDYQLTLRRDAIDRIHYSVLSFLQDRVEAQYDGIDWLAPESDSPWKTFAGLVR